MGFEPTCNSLVTRLGGCYVSLPYIYIYFFFFAGFSSWRKEKKQDSTVL